MKHHERGVRMVVDNAGKLESRWVAILSVSAKIGCAQKGQVRKHENPVFNGLGAIDIRDRRNRLSC